MSDRSTALGLFVVSAASLGLEILFTRFASILLSHDFVYGVVAIALLGFGAAGVLLSVSERLRVEIRRVPSGSALALGAASLLTLPALRAGGDGPAGLAILTLVLALPFAAAGASVASVLARGAKRIATLYALNLAGSGAGALGVFLLLRGLPGEAALGLLAALAALGAALLRRGEGPGGRGSYLPVALGAVSFGFAALAPRLLPVPVLTDKELPRMLDLGAELETSVWGDIARIDVVRLAGDSVRLPDPIAYRLITQDGDAPTAFLELPADPGRVDFIGSSLLGAAYWIRPRPRSVLVIGVGGGPDVQAALAAGAGRVTGVDVNDRLLSLLRGPYREAVGGFPARPEVTLVHADGRRYARGHPESFDVVQMSGIDTFAAAYGASQNRAESYLYTVEAFRDFFRALRPGGILSINYPAFHSLGLRLFATAVDALAAEGMIEPGASTIVSQTGGFTSLLVKKGALTREEVATVRARFSRPVASLYFPLYHRLWGAFEPSFLETNAVLFSPYPPEGESNHYYAYYGARAVGELPSFHAQFYENVRPALDDRPFFFVQDLWGKRAPHYRRVLTLLAVVADVALVVCVVPLLGSRAALPRAGILPTALYFLGVGLGYLFVEVVLIQKLSFYLGHPSFAVAFVLPALFLFSGAGSALSARLCSDPGRRAAWGVGAVAAAALAEWAFLDHALLAADWAFRATGGAGLAGRLGIALLLVAPLGLPMGVPFPAGLDRLARRTPALVPWAWAVNGVASVAGTLLALLVSMVAGHRAVLGLAAAAYVLGTAPFLVLARRDASP